MITSTFRIFHFFYSLCCSSLVFLEHQQHLVLITLLFLSCIVVTRTRQSYELDDLLWLYHFGLCNNCIIACDLSETNFSQNSHHIIFSPLSCNLNTTRISTFCQFTVNQNRPNSPVLDSRSKSFR